MRAAILVLLLTTALPGLLPAQAAPPSSDDGRAGAAAAVLVKAGSLAGSARLHLGGWVGLVLNDRISIGGVGYALTEMVELPGSEAGTGFDLGMGYGGLLATLRSSLTPEFHGEIGLLLGAGNASLQDRLVGLELGSDNFFVAEPTLGLSRTLPHNLHLGLAVGYRQVVGLQDLPTVVGSDLNAFTGTLSIRLGGG